MRSPFRVFSMIYVKSIVAGLVAIVIAVMMWFIVIMALLIYWSRQMNDTNATIGWDPVSFFRNSGILPWLILLSAFAVGFYWEFRRAAN